MEPHVQVGQPQVVGSCILPTAYFPPLPYMAAILRCHHAAPSGEEGSVLIEQWESYHKQTLRNRCLIDSPNGTLALTIPVQHGDARRVKDMRISEHGHWRHQHWQALRSSYANSPFFDYYQDDFRPIYEGSQRFLIDFNEEILLACLRLIDIPIPLRRTDRWLGSAYDTPPAPEAASIPYYQVFNTQGRGFVPGLSVADLLFNMGPESLLVLRRMADS